MPRDHRLPRPGFALNLSAGSAFPRPNWHKTGTEAWWPHIQKRKPFQGFCSGRVVVMRAMIRRPLPPMLCAVCVCGPDTQFRLLINLLPGQSKFRPLKNKLHPRNTGHHWFVATGFLVGGNSLWTGKWGACMQPLKPGIRIEPQPSCDWVVDQLAWVDNTSNSHGDELSWAPVTCCVDRRLYHPMYIPTGRLASHTQNLLLEQPGTALSWVRL